MAKKIKKPGRIRKSLGWAFKPFVNVTGWLGYSQVKQGFGNINSTVNDLFTVAEAEHEETFEEARERLHIDNAALHKQYENFRLMLTVCLVIAALLFMLSVYWIFTGGFFGGFFVLILALIGLANAFRYHFWMYQIKQQKLGCTTQEWLQGTFGKKRSP